MTVIVAGTLHFPNGTREQALSDNADLIAETRTQDGCLHYVWSADPTSDTRVYVYEKWDSVPALAAHLAGPFYLAMLGKLGTYGVYDIDIAKYRIDHEEPVYDPEGKPRADFFTG